MIRVDRTYILTGRTKIIINPKEYPAIKSRAGGWRGLKC